jgi:putative redox protein
MMAAMGYNVTVERTETGYRATNSFGASINFGVEGTFSPVELLLAALGGCNIVTVEPLTAKRGHRLKGLAATVTAEKVAPNKIASVTVTYDVELPPDDPEADAVFRAVAERVHERICTVSTALEELTPVTVVLPD